jgi:hypothetical protein
MSFLRGIVKSNASIILKAIGTHPFFALGELKGANGKINGLEVVPPHERKGRTDGTLLTNPYFYRYERRRIKRQEQIRGMGHEELAILGLMVQLGLSGRSGNIPGMRRPVCAPLASGGNALSPCEKKHPAGCFYFCARHTPDILL